MKKLLLFLFCFCSSMLFSQTVTLSKLSDKEVYRSLTLYDRESDDVYGYFYVFYVDQTDKKEFLFDYVLLDKNLNKVLEGKFTEKIGSWSNLIRLDLTYKKEYITFKWIDYHNKSLYDQRTKYRVLDLKTNTLSESFGLDKNLKRKTNYEQNSLKQSITFSFNPASSGYYLQGPILTNHEKGYTKLISFYYLLTDKSKYNEVFYANEKLELQWSFKYNKSGTIYKYEDVYLTNVDNKTDVILGKRLFKGKDNESSLKKGELFESFLFFEKQTGKLISEITPYGLNTINGTKVKEIATEKVFMESNDKMTFINNIMSEKTKDYSFNTEKLIGYSKSEFDIKTGKLIGHYKFTWDQLAKYLPMNEFGNISEKGDSDTFLYLHDALLKDNGNILFVFEQYKALGTNITRSGAKLYDLFFVELDAKLNVLDFKRIAKEVNTKKNRLGLSGIEAARIINYFDYAGYQQLGDDKYTFFYFNKQTPENGGEKQNVLGILQYENGKITEEKLNLKSTDDSELSILPAKKGYILILEQFNDKTKSDELRLEKIN